MQIFTGLCNWGLWSGESVGRPLGRAQAEAAVGRHSFFLSEALVVLFRFPAG